MATFSKSEKQELISNWQTGGLSQAEFCSRHTISKSTFYSWLRKAGITSKQRKIPALLREHPSPKFVEMDTSSSSVSPQRIDRKIVITTADGCRLEIPL